MRRLFAFCLVALWCCPSVSFAVTDEFDDDPTLGGDWEFYDPMGQSITSTQDGYFRYTFPLGVNMDHWTGIDNAAQLRRSDIPGDDFTVETRVNFVGSGDPEAPFWPPAVENYHAALTVAFGATDVFYWGFYRGSPLWLERSGTGGLCIVDPALQELSLQIKKVGDTYAFSWRETDDQAWSLVCTRGPVTQTPISVGLIFKTWAGLTSEETFDFDYFKLEEVADEAPALTFPCPLDDPDQAWLGMPYIRDAQLTGYPPPTWTLAQGPSTLIYDPAGLVTGWVPDSPGTVPIQLDFTNDAGSTTAAWDVRVSSASILRDDDFEVNPKDDPGGWTLYEPQTGIQYSTVEDAGTDWWRMQVPAAGDQGLNWDTWVGVDRAPQLQQPVDPEGDFLIETRVRVAPDATPPAEGAAFLAGLLVSFDGFTDLIHFNIGGLRNVNGVNSNVFAERSGMNNLANGYTAGIIGGKPVELRVEKRCTTYQFFFRGEGDATWTYVGKYSTPAQPQYVGLIMKTWGAVAWTVDFDYFDFVEPGPSASFTLTPAEGIEPLQVSVDGSASSSPNGAITAYEWDFGDGGTASGATAQHTYASRGDYVVQLTVTDASGDKGATTKPVQVLFRTGDVSPWTPTDIGAPVLAGGERPEGGCLRILAGGSDIGGTSDQFHFLHQSLTGDGSVVARVSEANWSVNGAKAGVMIREDLTPGSRHAAIVAQRSITSKYAYLRRIDTGGSTSAPRFSADAFALPNAWVKMERAGDELIGSYSADGVAWTEVDRVTIALPPTVYAGIALSARDTGQTGTEVLADVCDASVSGGGGKPVFHRGDANDDGGINITDGIFILNFLFLGGADPTCMEAANPNDDEAVNITDGIFVLNFLFLGGAAPLPPGPIEDPCGPDPDASPTDLGCETYSNC